MINRCPKCKEEQHFYCKICGGIGPFEMALKDRELLEDKHELGRMKDLPKEYNHYYVYFVKEYISTLDRSSQIAYYHYISNIPIRSTTALLRISKKQLKDILSNIYKNAWKFLSKNYVFNEDDDSYYRLYYKSLINENNDDEDLARLYDEDMATIKISRAFALEICAQS